MSFFTDKVGDKSSKRLAGVAMVAASIVGYISLVYLAGWLGLTPEQLAQLSSLTIWVAGIGCTLLGVSVIEHFSPLANKKKQTDGECTDGDC